MEESNWIDKVLTDARQGVVVRIRANSEEYEAAIDKALAYKLITDNTHHLTEKGYKAIKLGGFDKWITHREQREVKQQKGISVSGNAVIGNNNSGVFQGQDGTLINTGNKAHIDSYIEVRKGNFENLSRKLKENHVPDENIRELQSILDTDNPNQENSIFGNNTNAWISKMISKSLDGSWSISIGAAGELLADAIKGYYGWH